MLTNFDYDYRIQEMREKVLPSNYVSKPTGERWEGGYPPEYNHVALFEERKTGLYLAYVEGSWGYEAVLLDGNPIDQDGTVLNADIFAAVRVGKDAVTNMPTDRGQISMYNPIVTGGGQKIRKGLQGNMTDDPNRAALIPPYLRGERDIVFKGTIGRERHGRVVFTPSK